MTATNNFDPSCIIQDCSATENSQFHHSIHVYGGYKMFRGFLDDRSIIIKKFMGMGDEARSMAIRDIIISMQMSNHKNALKLLGCCLEIPVPALVHEYAPGVLNDQGGLWARENRSLLSWKTRLRIANQLANAVTYLHTAFPRPIIHRDLKPSCIFLDHDYVPKLCNFSLSITIPPMKSHADDEVKGTFGFLDPSYMKSGYISEKSDVYSFGVHLLLLLTGKKAVDTYEAGDCYQSIIAYVKLHVSDIEQIQTIVDPKILGEVKGDEQAQRNLHDFLALALLCTQDESEARPDMMNVAKELLRIENSTFPY